MLEPDKQAFLRRLEVMALRTTIFNHGKTPNEVLVHYPVTHEPIGIAIRGKPFLSIRNPSKNIKFINEERTHLVTPTLEQSGIHSPAGSAERT